MSTRTGSNWTHEDVRAWVERHGGNVTALARRLRVPRVALQSWLADPKRAASARTAPPYIVAHMESIDHYEMAIAMGHGIAETDIQYADQTLTAAQVENVERLLEIWLQPSH